MENPAMFECCYRYCILSRGKQHSVVTKSMFWMAKVMGMLVQYGTEPIQAVTTNFERSPAH
jgi:hypothetical protein